NPELCWNASLRRGRHPQTTLLVRLTSQLFRAVSWAGCSRPWPVSGVPGSLACRLHESTQPTGPGRAASLPGKGTQLELEEVLVPRKMSISLLQSWLTARGLLPRLDARTPGAAAPAQFYECLPSQTVEGAKQEEKAWDTPQMQHKNVLKTRQRKMNRHKHRKRGRPLKRKPIKLKRDARRICEKAALKETPGVFGTCNPSYLKG
uniref:Mitochondrial mRNA-processing protein COX24 C-terminal domain-containing protein n=1 Tax=Piliocolobus tephrosceles TaxID=591936 RepID=A0A8C9HLZ4_9PRIM